MTTRHTMLMLFAWLAIGCSEDAAPGAPWAGGGSSDGYGSGGYGDTAVAPATAPVNSDCVGNVPAYEDVAAFDKCVMCHDSAKPAGQRKSAPITVNFDTEAAAQSHAMQAVNVVRAGVMPPAPSGLTLTDAEKQQLYVWAMCSM
jgi:hypothetical protein